MRSTPDELSSSVRTRSPADALAASRPIAATPLTATSAEGIAPLLKALGDPARLRMVSILASHVDGEASVLELNRAFDLTKPTISHHLSVLHAVGMLERTKRGLLVFYRVRPQVLKDFNLWFGSVTP